MTKTEITWANSTMSEVVTVLRMYSVGGSQSKAVKTSYQQSVLNVDMTLNSFGKEVGVEVLAAVDRGNGMGEFSSGYSQNLNTRKIVVITAVMTVVFEQRVHYYLGSRHFLSPYPNFSSPCIVGSGTRFLTR